MHPNGLSGNVQLTGLHCTGRENQVICRSIGLSLDRALNQLNALEISAECETREGLPCKHEAEPEIPWAEPHRTVEVRITGFRIPY